MSLPYRDFLYPLNVFMHILTHEEGGVSYLHYGFFERDDESIAVAQERSTRMLLDRLPLPPARILDVGSGLGTTLARLTSLGYDARGVNPDAQQVAVIRERHGEGVQIDCIRFEEVSPSPFDTVVFQESSQYIDSEALFAKAAELTKHVIIIDEFSLQPLDVPGALRPLAGLLAAAERHGFRKTEELDVSAKAIPTTRYFMKHFEQYRERLIAEVGISSQQVDELIAGGVKYVELYAQGVYGYRVMQWLRD